MQDRASAPPQWARRGEVTRTSAKVHVPLDGELSGSRNSLTDASKATHGARAEQKHAGQHRRTACSSSRRPSFSRLAASSTQRAECNHKALHSRTSERQHSRTLASGSHQLFNRRGLSARTKIKLLDLRSYCLKSAHASQENGSTRHDQGSSMHRQQIIGARWEERLRRASAKETRCRSRVRLTGVRRCKHSRDDTQKWPCTKTG